MKTGIAIAGLVLMLAPVALAKDNQSYDKGTLLSMDSSQCGLAEKDGKTLAGEIIGTDSSHKATQEVLCQEYVLQGDHITYHIRPEDSKHPALLPVGEMVEYRIHKDKLYLMNPEGDKKERAYSVVSMQVRQDVKDARNVQP
ncbi:MAG TPA: hypothetical protein VMD78_00525 [Candidatus Baltobacteraceae bacterium]|nr:hypothetical protein [Candidatus Baltobacteraceae bacterium]